MRNMRVFFNNLNYFLYSIIILITNVNPVDICRDLY